MCPRCYTSSTLVREKMSDKHLRECIIWWILADKPQGDKERTVLYLPNLLSFYPHNNRP